ncbi:tyrosine-type recombinase/integrase [Sporosalibacterium faouarense]|uniref:tyrosine-type recombinase/integrase n=1 Tax=Sporosalibacterium faouarense TaxID=516123 RepID=UPI00192BD637|nr:tyrosine-type recombinase/integrase [Sporosalibacterium faouarense]
MKNSDFQGLLQNFFLERLINQQKVSYYTIQSYKDTFRIFLKYMNDEHGVSAYTITMEAINADTVVEFLNYLESHRKNKCKTVNNRLAAIKSFMEYISYEAPEYLSIVRRVKAIPFRNVEKKEISYLTKEEIDALLNTCKSSTPDGRRDYLMILLLYNSGMRVSEMISMQRKDVIIPSNGSCHLRIMGKGRKERTIPLWQTTTKYLIQYMNEHEIHNNDYLLSGRNVEHLTRSGVRYRIACIAKEASCKCPSLEYKSVTPHVFRHSTAMSLLQSGVDISTIAIWLGHESIETTHKYMIADMKLKENALKKLHEPEPRYLNSRYNAANDILQFLKSL